MHIDKACEQSFFTLKREVIAPKRDCNEKVLLYCIGENALCTRIEVEALNELNGGKEAFPGNRFFFVINVS